MIRVSGDPCPRFSSEPASVVKKALSLGHLGPANLARRIGAEPVNEKLVHAEPIKRTDPIKRTASPGLNEQTRAAKLAVARAALGENAVKPEPLVDTTKVRGKGRPKKWANDAERMAAKRKTHLPTL